MKSQPTTCEEANMFATLVGSRLSTLRRKGILQREDLVYIQSRLEHLLIDDQTVNSVREIREAVAKILIRVAP